MSVLEIKNLNKTFLSHFAVHKYHILKDVSLRVEQGEIYGFLGPNGAGKTTTIKSIIGLIQPESGEILINGVPADHMAVKDRLGFLPENPYFYDYLTAEELLTFTAMLFSIPARQITSRIRDLLQLVGLGDDDRLKSLKLRKYSKGMVQRIGLAQAMINDPDFLILDEPFSGLDPIGRKELRDIILNLKKLNKTIFFSSHILQDMELMVDKVGIIFNGRMIREGKLSDMLTNSIFHFEIIARGLTENHALNLDKSAVMRDKHAIIKIAREADINIALQTIISLGGQVTAITPIRQTLEDIFLHEIRDHHEN
jgi:ABC-2 type transport system ATP-binding protein